MATPIDTIPYPKIYFHSISTLFITQFIYYGLQSIRKLQSRVQIILFGTFAWFAAANDASAATKSAAQTVAVDQATESLTTEIRF